MQRTTLALKVLGLWAVFFCCCGFVATSTALLIAAGVAAATTAAVTIEGKHASDVANKAQKTAAGNLQAALPPLPASPLVTASPAAAAAQAVEAQRTKLAQGAASAAQTVLTSPLGVPTQPNIGVKTLLGAG